MSTPTQSKQLTQRKQHFTRWWKRNHHRISSHYWLAKNAKRIAFAYHLNPTAYEDIYYITKRFFAQSHPRLTQPQAWKLWKLCNPTVTERTARLLDAAETLDEAGINSLERRSTKITVKRKPRLKISEQAR